MKRKSREIERRKFKRLAIPIPLHLRLLGLLGNPPPLRTETRNVSPEGLSIELAVTLEDGSLLLQHERPIKLIPYLVLNIKLVAIKISMPSGEELNAKGRFVWYDFGSRGSAYYLAAGIVLEEMTGDERRKWEEFVKHAP